MHVQEQLSNRVKIGCFRAAFVLLSSVFFLLPSATAKAAVATDPAHTPTIAQAVTVADVPVIQKRNWFQRFFFKPSWAQAVSECATPEDVCRMVRKHVAYREETLDRWASAKETWERGYGDCEDFAICVQAMCRELGLEASVQLFYTLSPSLTGHAIARGAGSDGSMWFSSNGSFEAAGTSQQVSDRVADTLWCDSRRMWNVMVADNEVDRLVSSGASLNTIGAAPVAVSAQ